MRGGQDLGRSRPLLYAANTIGAAGGALAAGFYLPAALGFRNTYLLAITLNLAIGVTAIALARRDHAVPEPPSKRSSQTVGKIRRPAPPIFGSLPSSRFSPDS